MFLSSEVRRACLNVLGKMPGTSNGLMNCANAGKTVAFLKMGVDVG